MTEEQKAAEWGCIVMGALETVRNAEAGLPSGFAVGSLETIVRTSDGERWALTLKRATLDANDDTSSEEPRKTPENGNSA